jgi:hypothetical protein
METFQPTSTSVLITGVYLTDRPNTMDHIVKQFDAPSRWRVVQKWFAKGRGTPPEEVRKVTVEHLSSGPPKFILLNKFLAEERLDSYDFVIICDDDITLPSFFLDAYLDLVLEYDFALAQPARTHNSYIDHPIVEQVDGLKARRTRFVEIGPLVSIRRDIYSDIFPFDERCPMGWGFDFVWPFLIERRGLKMGIIDATPLDHSFRKPTKTYNYSEAKKSMEDYLSKKPHLSREEAFRILESYA